VSAVADDIPPGVRAGAAGFLSRDRREQERVDVMASSRLSDRCGKGNPSPGEVAGSDCHVRYRTHRGLNHPDERV
jgi:hypothetical protein